MSFSVSPAVNVREIDASQVISETISSLGSFAGKFIWGPVNELTLVTNETNLVSQFGEPNNDTYEDFFSLASFLSYTNGAYAVRIDEGGTNAGDANGSVKVRNFEEFPGTVFSGNTFIARYPGAKGNSLDVIICESADAYRSVVNANVTLSFASNGEPNYSRQIPYIVTEGDITDYFAFGDFLVVDGIRYQIVDIDTGESELIIDRLYTGAATPAKIERIWGYANEFGEAPDEGTVHIVVVDRGGEFTKEPGYVLEVYNSVGIEEGYRNDEGDNWFVVDVINTYSQFIYTAETTTFAINTAAKISKTHEFDNGTDNAGQVGNSAYIDGYQLFANTSTVDAPLMIGGSAAIKSTDEAGSVVANFIIDNIVERRKDCVLFVSPAKDAVLSGTDSAKLEKVLACRENLGSTSYAIMDGNWKYMYDKYNDKFRWVPLNGDHAGIYARNDANREVWVSAAGTSKGVLKNVVKLAWNPDMPFRDEMYVKDVNPIITLPVVGPVVYGDKTLLGKNSAFSRINVRRLFITLEKAIATASAELLFEFNDEFTQRKFVSMVEPFLRDVKGRRGISDYLVVADASVNTPQVVQNNRFVGQIFIKPNYSINFIRLDFVAVNASAEFSEVAV